MGRFDDDINMAAEMIREDGELASLTVVEQAENPDRPWEPSEPVERTHDAPMVFLNFTDQSNAGSAGQRYFNGTQIEEGDKKVLLAAKGLPFPPKLQATITRKDGSLWKIENIKTLDPNGQHILYTILVRQ